jgi:hypothetical protein
MGGNGSPKRDNKVKFEARINPKTGDHEVVDLASNVELSMSDIAHLLNEWAPR